MPEHYVGQSSLCCELNPPKTVYELVINGLVANFLSPCGPFTIHEFFCFVNPAARARVVDCATTVAVADTGRYASYPAVMTALLCTLLIGPNCLFAELIQFGES